MNGADFASQSDPACNKHFRRRWTGPPPKRERGPVLGAALDQDINITRQESSTTGSVEEEAAVRWAERLGIAVHLGGAAMHMPQPGLSSIRRRRPRINSVAVVVIAKFPLQGRKR